MSMEQNAVVRWVDSGEIADNALAPGGLIRKFVGFLRHAAAHERAYAVKALARVYFDADALPGKIEIGLPLGATIVHEVRLTGGASLKVAGPRAMGALALPPGSDIAVKPAISGAVRIYPEI